MAILATSVHVLTLSYNGCCLPKQVSHESRPQAATLQRIPKLLVCLILYSQEKSSSFSPPPPYVSLFVCENFMLTWCDFFTVIAIVVSVLFWRYHRRVRQHQPTHIFTTTDSHDENPSIVTAAPRSLSDADKLSPNITPCNVPLMDSMV